MKEPAAECIAVRAFFGVELKDKIVIENLVFKANDERSDVASYVLKFLTSISWHC